MVWSGGLGWALEEITAITTPVPHVDAPYHYHPTSRGRPARRIDELPLEWFLAPAVRLMCDISRREADPVSDLEEALAGSITCGPATWSPHDRRDRFITARSTIASRDWGGKRCCGLWIRECG